MRVLFMPLGLSTHYLHLVPLAWAFRSAGHEVRIASQGQAVESILRSGMTLSHVGRDYDFVENWKRTLVELGRTIEAGDDRRAEAARRSPEERERLINLRTEPFLKSAVAMMADLIPLARSWQPDLVIADPLVLAAPLLAKSIGVPLVHHLYGPAVNERVGFGGVGPGTMPWPDGLRQLFADYGLAARAQYSVRAVDPCPDSLQFPGVPNRLPIRYVPYNGPGVAPAWLSEPVARPRICVTWGATHTEMVGSSNFLVPQILTALEGIDADVVVAVSAADRDLVTATSPNVRIEVGLPLHTLLPTCDAIVHHGSSGTMLTAASAGVPQVIVPVFMDRAEIAQLVADSGAGVHVPLETADTAHLSAAVTRALSDPTMKKSAESLRQEMLATPSPSEVVKTLEELS
ncbi:nucleotide disphospho-sugar-binding domain-containing protein [Micromonospora eburnea]|uniref:UDP:flavonoid glycosyltransferase YjiC, YdhE family n=1 Tax=Micromonospora eburnea TaxID=227316 RepID=A0A1C6V0Y0_9ACTN|nr:nucleotide disphospho-sugar-binding domain-containing protein [Micromonospora eburnea]SCL59959.1 UDP:flavonoid glycosyltransferase YjiC, YdhE family [Micromonospora eburnea]